MYIEQLYTNCLAEAAYWIESEGEAVVIDPIRETEPYLRKAEERGVKIKYVFETHFHADFVSGHIDLARLTGASIVFGPGAETAYDAIIASDGQEFVVGKIRLRVLHTPGHTPESSCFLLIDENEKEHSIFTGDTLFVGDVGRPDLLDGKMSSEELASMLYDSLNKKIKILADDVIVYPAHGPGSACGKNIGKETWSTVGEQRRSNYALREMSREEFIKAVTDGLTPPPQYFFDDARINKEGYESIDKVLGRNVKPLAVADVKKAMSEGAIVLDTRHQDQFETGFIPGAMNIGLDGSFAVWAGTLLSISSTLVVIAPQGREHETILRLARVGYENVLGYLEGGMDSWKNSGEKTATVTSVSSEEFASDINSGSNRQVLDVRRIAEYETAHVKGAENICLSTFLSGGLDEVDPSKPYYVHCAAGYRSMIASSILSAKGFTNFVNVHGGFGKIKQTSAPLETAAVQV